MKKNPCRIILNTKTDSGFLINILPQALTGCNVWVSWSLFLAFFIGLCSYIKAFVDDFKINIDEIFQKIDDKSDLTEENHHRMTNMLLNESIELHAEVTE